MFVLVSRFHILLLTVLLAVTGVAIYRIAPDFSYPAHWGARSQPDWLWPRDMALAIALVVAVALLAAFELLARGLGKERMGYYHHILDPALSLLLGIVAAVQLGLLLTGIGSDLDLVRITVFGLGAMLIGLGIILAEAERHTYAGLRMPWKIASDRAWKLVHRVAGLAFGLSGAGLLLLAWQTSDLGPLVLALPLALLLPALLAGIATVAADRAS